MTTECPLRVPLRDLRRDRRSARQLHLPLAACLALLLAGCDDDDDDNGGASPIQPGPTLLDRALYVDDNGDGAVSAGDVVVVRYDQDVVIRDASVVPFVLPVDGDRFGTGATLEAAGRADEVRIVLGSNARLQAAGAYVDDTNGSPSAVGQQPSDAIVSADGGRSTGTTPPRDLAAGFVRRDANTTGVRGSNVASGDLDGDGDQDLIVAADGADAIVLFAESAAVGGALNFVDIGVRLGRGAALALGDLDLDGDIDAVVGSDSSAVTVWHNDGSGVFAQVQSLPVAATRALALGDLDDDADLDLVRGIGGAAFDEVWNNDGAGTFAAGPTFGSGDTLVVRITDVDDDADPDVIQGRADGTKIFFNDGLGGLVDGATLASADTRAVALVDFDGDSDLDVVTGGLSAAELFRNDGAGSFVAVATLDDTATSGLEVLDFDGDGRPDLFVATTDGRDDELWTIGADGALARTAVTFANGTTTDAVVRDFDRDGDLDVVTVAPDQPVRLLSSSLSASRGALEFVDGGVVLGQGPVLAVASGDIDRDGDVDLVAARGDLFPTVVFRNDGDGTFPNRTDLVLGGRDVALGDLDDDGDLDIVETGTSTGMRLWRLGPFGTVSGAEPISATGGQGVALFDVDRDDDLDLLQLRAAFAAELWTNDDQAQFTLVTTSALPEADAVATGDFDRDGDLDLVFATDQGAQLVKTQGPGNLTPFATFGSADLDAIAAADVDGDGDLDLAVGGAGGFAIWNNDGTGNFTQLDPLSGVTTNVLRFADVDGDGQIDLLRGGNLGAELWRNDAGNFLQATITLAQTEIRDATCADLDGDGDLDVALADAAPAGGVRVFLQR